MDILNFNIRQHHSMGEDFLISFIVLGLALSIAYRHIISGYTPEKFLFLLLPAGMLSSFIAIGLSYFSMSFLSDRYGYRVNFTLFTSGIIFALLTSIFGFIISLPGSTRIVGSANNEIEGKIALSAPFTNMMFGAIFSGFSFISSGALSEIFLIISGSSLMVAVFSSLPIPPLPGYSILKWNLYIYIIELAFSVTFLVALGHGFI